MLLENWKDIKLDESVDEINRKRLDENATLPTISTWKLGEGYKRPYKGLQSESVYSNTDDTELFIERMNFSDIPSERLDEKSQRLQEGPGAGYSIYFYDIKIKNVKIDKIWEDRYGVQYADFTAEIVPGRYDWSADGYDWAVGERNKEFDGDMTFYDKVEIKEGSTVEGSCENGYQAWGDPNSTWTEEDFIKEIQGEEYILGELFGGGYIHSDIPDEYHMEDDIDCSDERSGYKNSYVSSADLKLDAGVINQAIEDTRDYDDEDLEDEDYDEDIEESQKLTGRLTERVHKIEHGDIIIGYAEPGEWEHLFFEGKPCGHITEDGEVYLCKDCPQEVYDTFSDYQLTKCSFLDSNLDPEEDDRYEDYDLNDAADDFAKDFEEYRKSDKSRLRESSGRKYAIHFKSDSDEPWAESSGYVGMKDGYPTTLLMFEEEGDAFLFDSEEEAQSVIDEDPLIQEYIEDGDEYTVEDVTEDYEEYLNDLHLATDDRQAGQWYESKKSDKSKLKVGNIVKYNGKSYKVAQFVDGNVTIVGHGKSITLSPDKVEKIFEESRRHPDPNKWKKGDWAVYDGKLYVTSMFLGGDMVKLESPNESIVVPQSKVYKATKKDIYHESKKSDKSRLKEYSGEISEKDIQEAYNHYVKDLGKTPSVDDVLETMETQNRDYLEYWDTPQKISKFYGAIKDYLRREGLDFLDESSVSKRLEEPICYVIKNTKTGEYATFPTECVGPFHFITNLGWSKNLGEAESFDDREEALDILDREIIRTMDLERNEGEDDLDYEERNLDYKDSLRDDTFIIEPVYRDSLNESTLREGKVRSERKDYPYGISKYTDYEDDQVKRSYYSLPYGFRSDRDDQEDWEKDLRYKAYLDYHKEVADWMDKNGDAWNTATEEFNNSVSKYEKEIRALSDEARNTEEYKAISKDLDKARHYRDYAREHKWQSTYDRQSKLVNKLQKTKDDFVKDYIVNHSNSVDPRKGAVDPYQKDFDSIYDAHSSKLNSDIEARKAQFATAAEGKELFSGRDNDNTHHFYYKNGDKYRQIGSRYSVQYPFGSNRGIRDYYESPDATQEFEDYDAKDIRFLTPVSGWNSKVHTKEEDSTD